MSEERLQEIRSNINYLSGLDYDVKDEVELYNEVIRLKKENEILKQNNINEILKNDLSICAKQYKKSEEKLEKANKKIEKAVEYIERSIKESQLIFGWNDIQRYHDNEMNELLNILNGRNDE